MTPSLTQMRERRLNAGLSQVAAAKKLGVSKRLIADIENGADVRPHPRNAKAIADFFGCKVTDLWPVDEREAEAA